MNWFTNLFTKKKPPEPDFPPINIPKDLIDKHLEMKKVMVGAAVANPKPKWLILAEKQNGVKEGPGASNNPVVVNFWKQAGIPWIKDDATAWCAAFVGAMLEQAGHPGTKKPNARSYVPGEWKNGVALARPALGCICVLSRPPSKWTGHVFFVTGIDDKFVYGIGGNTSDAVKYAKFPLTRVVSYAWPKTAPLPLYYLEKKTQDVPTSTNEG